MNGLRMIALLALVAMTAAAQQPGGTTTEQTPLPGLNGYSVADALDANGNIRQLLVYRQGERVQALDLCTGAAVARQGEVGDITATDYNFDGHPDLAMVTAAHDGRRTYCVWLFDPRTQQFVASPELSRITNLAADPETKTLVSHVAQDCAGGCFQHDVYEWPGGRLRLIESVSQSEQQELPLDTDCRFVRTIRHAQEARMLEEPRQMVDRGGSRCGPIQRP